MWKVRFMAEEFLRSFQKSLFKNILLMLMFSISLVMAVVMCSYYFDLGEKYQTLTQKMDDGEWFALDMITESNQEVNNRLMTVSGCCDMISLYEAVQSVEEAPIFSVDTQGSLALREEDVKRLFGGKDFLPFSADTETATVDFGDGDYCLKREMKGAEVDLGAYRYFNLRVQEGEGFTEENLVIERAKDPIPILLGSDYKEIIEIGTPIDVNYWCEFYHCKVIGILEKDSSLPPDGNMTYGESVTLNDKIVFPYGGKLLEKPQSLDEIHNYAIASYVGLQNAYVRTDGVHIRELVETYRQLGKQFGYPPVQIVGTSMGVDLFRKESASSVRVLLVLTVVLLCFSFYGLFVTFYDKIQSNSKVYGIYLMNGCSLSMILVPCLLEIAVILFPAVLLGKYILTSGELSVGQYFRAGPIMQAVYVLMGLAFLVGAAFLAYLMRGVDTEHLIRQKD